MRLAEHSVSVGHWTFLRILWVNDGMTQSELSERAGLMQPTTFFAVNGMEQLGYIRREKLPNSRRNVHIFLTPAGRALRKKLVALRRRNRRAGGRRHFRPATSPRRAAPCSP